MRLILNEDNSVKKSWKQYMYNIFFLIFLIFGISFGLALSLLLFQTITFKSNPDLYFGIFGVTGWLIIMGIIEIMKSLKTDIIEG